MKNSLIQKKMTKVKFFLICIKKKKILIKDKKEDEIKNLLDDLDIKIYEKNYDKCWEYYNFLFEMRKS